MGSGNVVAGVSNGEVPATTTSSGCFVKTSGSETGTLDPWEEEIVADVKRELGSRASGFIIPGVPSSVPPNPGDPVDSLTPALLLFSPPHNGFAASFTGALGVGPWGRPVQVAGMSEEDVDVGTPSGFVSANELVKKVGTLLSFTSTLEGPTSEAGVGSADGPFTGGDIDGRRSTTGAGDEALTTGVAEDETASRGEASTPKEASGAVAMSEVDECNTCACCGSSICSADGIGVVLVKEKGKELMGGSFALAASCFMGSV